MPLFLCGVQEVSKVLRAPFLLSTFVFEALKALLLWVVALEVFSFVLCLSTFTRNWKILG